MRSMPTGTTESIDSNSYPNRLDSSEAFVWLERDSNAAGSKFSSFKTLGLG